MKQKRFTEEQIVKALKEIEAGWVTVAEQARKLACSENTIYLWKKVLINLDIQRPL